MDGEKSGRWSGTRLPEEIWNLIRAAASKPVAAGLQKLGLKELIEGWMGYVEEELDYLDREVRTLQKRAQISEKLEEHLKLERERLKESRQAWENYEERNESYRKEVLARMDKNSKLSILVSDQLTKAVSSLEETIRKAIEDGQRPRMRPPGGL